MQLQTKIQAIMRNRKLLWLRSATLPAGRAAAACGEWRLPGWRATKFTSAPVRPGATKEACGAVSCRAGCSAGWREVAGAVALKPILAEGIHERSWRVEIHGSVVIEDAEAGPILAKHLNER